MQLDLISSRIELRTLYSRSFLQRPFQQKPDQKRIEREAREVEYEPVIRAAVSAKPNLWCFPNGYVNNEDGHPISKRPCAQVGQFRVLDQFASMVSTVEIYKVFEDGTVRPAAYHRDYETGFIADEKVTSLVELKTAFGVK